MTPVDETLLKRVLTALKPAVPQGRSFLNDAVDAKVAEKQGTFRAPWSDVTPEEKAAAESAQLDAAVVAARADAAQQSAGGFGGGAQGAGTSGGDDFNSELRRGILGG
jgi:hypothetical protein